MLSLIFSNATSSEKLTLECRPSQKLTSHSKFEFKTEKLLTLFIFSQVWFRLSPQSKVRYSWSYRNCVKLHHVSNLFSSVDLPRNWLHIQNFDLKLKQFSHYSFFRKLGFNYLRCLKSERCFLIQILSSSILWATYSPGSTSPDTDFTFQI